MDRQLIEEYVACGTRLRHAVAGLSPEELTARPGPGDWSILELVIHLTDSDDEIAQKIRKAKTDPDPLPADPAALDGRPEAKNLVGIYAAVNDESVEQVLTRFAGEGSNAARSSLTKLRASATGTSVSLAPCTTRNGGAPWCT